MKNQAGVWIDSKKAVVIILYKKNEEITVVNSSIEGRERIEGETKLFGRFGSQYLNAEKKKENRKMQDIQHYLKKVVNELKGTREVVIFGPAEMKTELEKYIMHESIRAPVIKRVETADSMTQNQMVAWVKKFYQNS